MKNFIHKISDVAIIFSFIFVLGTAGASDLNNITWDQFWHQILISGIIFVISIFVWLQTQTNNSKGE